VYVNDTQKRSLNQPVLSNAR